MSYNHIFEGIDVRLFRGIDPPEADANRAFAYIFAVTTGASVGFARTTDNLGPLETWVNASSVVFLAATLLYVVLSTDDLQCRANRLLRCGITMLVSLFIAAALNSTYPIGYPSSLGGASRVELFATLAACAAAYVVWRMLDILHHRFSEAFIRLVLQARAIPAEAGFAALAGLVVLLMRTPRL